MSYAITLTVYVLKDYLWKQGGAQKILLGKERGCRMSQDITSVLSVIFHT